jgi:recombination protein RecT
MAQEKTIADIAGALEAIREEWPNLCTNPKMRFDKEKEWALQACEKNEYSMKAALANIDAVCSAFRNVAAVGVTLDPARKLASILPREKTLMVYDLSYMGLLHLATTSGGIVWGQARVVHEKDEFELLGYDEAPKHKFKPFEKDRGPVVGAYVVVKLPSGDYLTNPLHVDDINAIRDRSPAWKASKSGPWKTDWEEMAKKTCVKNAWKYWPDPGEALARAVHYLNTDGGQGIDTDGTQTRKVLLDEWKGKLATAETGEAVAALWTAGREAFKAAEDPEGYEQFKKFVADRNRELGVKPPEKKDGAPGAPTTAPTTAPAPTQRATRPQVPDVKTLKPGEATYAQIASVITHAEDDDTLEACGPLIDELKVPQGADLGEQQGQLNALFNDRLEYLNKKFGR